MSSVCSDTVSEKSQDAENKETQCSAELHLNGHTPSPLNQHKDSLKGEASSGSQEITFSYFLSHVLEPCGGSCINTIIPYSLRVVQGDKKFFIRVRGLRSPSSVLSPMDTDRDGRVKTP